MDRTELRYDLWEGATRARRFILYPFILIVVIGSIALGTLYAVQTQAIPDQAEVMKQAETQASTDMYADSFIAGLMCMKTGGDGGCDINGNKSSMITTVTAGTLTINDKEYSTADSASIQKTMDDSALGDLHYPTLITDEKGSMNNVITYNDGAHDVTFTFTQDENGEMIVQEVTTSKTQETQEPTENATND